MARYAWIIDKHPAHDPEDDPNLNRTGVIGPRDASERYLAVLSEGGGLKFRMRCDDEVIYEGRIAGDDSITQFEPLDDLGTPDWGCNEIQYREDRRWVTL